MDKLSVQAIMGATGISRSHAYDILAGRQTPSITVALKIYDKTGEKLGLLNGLSPSSIELIRENAARDKAA